MAQFCDSIKHIPIKEIVVHKLKWAEQCTRRVPGSREEQSFLNGFLVLKALLCSWPGADKEYYRGGAQPGQMVNRLESGTVMLF